ncbi:ABC transporter substrate-binding protein [Xanthobacteraceae bacterium Astr-EGSB]|uniref:ABC transporter substrate-binding protein n=1 Tax=Astrobacterium formosum TaxID=3069710 RepID=UPI0027B08868|nr:ABC transporter substrate-binding protein [Xanthobacteraceae bacterium Astr-EGSB]
MRVRECRSQAIEVDGARRQPQSHEVGATLEDAGPDASACQPGFLRIWLATLTAILCLCSYAYALDRPRVVSINMCTDQLLLALADPPQILGLSPYGRDRARSWAAEAAGGYPQLSGGAEEILMLAPDFVVSSRYTKRSTREILKTQGVTVAEFDSALTIEDTKRQIVRMGALLGQEGRAMAAIARIDSALVRVRAAASRTPFRVLPLARRGWVSGRDSLMSALLSAAGLVNASEELGFRSGGFASLEQVVMARPDFLLVESERDFAEDQGVALLMHPVIEKLYPRNKRLLLPEKLTVCGGPMLAEALDRLTAEIERVGR